MKSRLFAIGDLHLSFSEEKPMEVFGAEWEDHHKKIEENWRSSVSEEDYVIVCGDISWALKTEDAMPDLEWLRALPGVKLLLRGNHDYWWAGISKLRDMWSDERLRFLQNDAVLLRDICLADGSCGDVAIAGSRGWLTPGDKNYSEKEDRKIYERELLRFEMSLKAAKKTGADTIIVALHYPPTGGGFESGFTELIKSYDVTKVVYGHLHGYNAWPKGIKGEIGGVVYSLVSADYTDFSPVNI